MSTTTTTGPADDGSALEPAESGLIDAQPEAARPHLRRIVAAVHLRDVDAAERAARDVPATDRALTAEALEGLAWSVRVTFVRPKEWQRVEERRTSVCAYWFATAWLTDDGAALGRVLLRLSAGADGVGIDAVRRVLADRPAAFRRAFGRAYDVHRVAPLWVAARTLAAEGLLPPPRPLDTVAILRLSWPGLPEARRADPAVGELLDRLWTTPQAGRAIGTTLGDTRYYRPYFELRADRSSYPDEHWAGLLGAWGATDPERRPAVIDACLAALAGAAGDRPSDLRGWALVHGRLQVGDAEAASRHSAYLALASGGAAPAAAIGRAVLERLLDAGSLDTVGLVDTAADALLRPEKGAVREYLDLLDRAVRAGAVDAASCAEVVQSVLAELPRGVDSRARRLLTAWGSAVPSAGAGAGPAAADGAATGPDTSAQAWVPPAPVDLPEPAGVTALTSVDDLVDLLLQVLSGQGEPIDVERALDGMMRLRDASPVVGDHLLRQVDWRSGRLVHGLSSLVSGWLGHDLAPARFGSRSREVRVYDEGEVVPGAHVRAERWVPGYGPAADGPFSALARDSWLCAWDEVCWVPSELVGARFAELLTLVTGAPAGSLALPTHTHGGIDGASLVARLRERTAAGRPPGARELATAVLRLAPEDRDAVLASGALPDHAAASLQRLGAPLAFRQVVAEPQWLAYEARRPVGAVVLWQPDDAAASGRTAAGDDPVHWWLDTRSVVDQWTDHSGAPNMRLHDVDLASWLLHLPWHPDVAAVHMQPEIVSSTELADADLTGLLRTLGDRRAPLGPQATDLLCWAATYKNARVRAAASEAIAATARHGILSGAELGRSVLRLVGPEAGPFLKSQSYLGPEPPKVSRIATTLADVARVHEHGEGAVLAAVVATFPEIRSTRGGVALLELGAQIAERRGIRVTLPESLASLAAGRASSRLAEEARRISGVGRTAVLWEPRPGS